MDLCAQTHGSSNTSCNCCTTFVRETIVKTLNYHILEKLVTKVNYSSIIIAHESEF